VVRDMVVQVVSVPVADADFDGLERGEDVELGDCYLGQGVQSHSVIQKHQVQPSGPAPAPGVRPVFMAQVDEHVALFPVDLGGKGLTHPGQIGLGDADDPVDVARPIPVPTQAPPAVGFEDVTKG